MNAIQCFTKLKILILLERKSSTTCKEKPKNRFKTMLNCKLFRKLMKIKFWQKMMTHLQEYAKKAEKSLSFQKENHQQPVNKKKPIWNHAQLKVFRKNLWQSSFDRRWWYTSENMLKNMKIFNSFRKNIVREPGDIAHWSFSFDKLFTPHSNEQGAWQFAYYKHDYHQYTKSTYIEYTNTRKHTKQSTNHHSKDTFDKHSYKI